MSLLARRRSKASINIIPLMDVLTILIFFFLVSMQFKEMTTLNLTLPKIESAGRNDYPERILIGADKDGRIYLENQPIQIDELKAVLSELAKVSNDIPVLLKLDEETTVETMTEVMDACRLNGLSKIRLQSR